MAPGEFVRGLESIALLEDNDLVGEEETGLLGEEATWVEEDEDGRGFLEFFC